MMELGSSNRKVTKKSKALFDAEHLYQIFIMVSVGLLTLTCIFPFIYVIGMSFASEGELLARGNFLIIPSKPIIASYKFILNQPNFMSALTISALRTVIGTFMALVVTLIAAYVLAQRDLPGRKWILLYLIVTIFLNGGLIPSYMLYSKLKLLNKFWVMVIPMMGNTFGILIVKIFIEGLPRDIIESVDLDGANDLQKLFFIIAPLTKPSLAAIGLFTAVGHWNSWFDAMVYIRDRKLMPMQLLIRNLLVSVQVNQSASGQVMLMEKIPSTGFKMAAVIVGMVPILCVYPFLQKYFMFGTFTGSIKE
jgi:putative aldouronate transport system permease protein